MISMEDLLKWSQEDVSRFKGMCKACFLYNQNLCTHVKSVTDNLLLGKDYSALGCRGIYGNNKYYKVVFTNQIRNYRLFRSGVL